MVSRNLSLLRQLGGNYITRGGTKHIQPKTSVKDFLSSFLISTCNALPLDG